MQIIYDGGIFSYQAHGGINTYFLNLFSRIPDGCKANLLASTASRAVFPRFPRVDIEYLHSTRIWPRTVGKWVERRLHSRRISSLGTGRIMHPTYYNLLFDLPFSEIRVPIVVTVWDMIHEIYPQHYDTTGEKAEIKKKAILAASKILCISEKTKNDLLDFYKIPESKIQVILLAPGNMNLNIAGIHDTASRPYFLYVGGRKFHKNFSGLLKAFANVSSMDKDIVLIVVGRQFETHELKLIDSMGVMHRVKNVGDVDNSVLASLYQQSVALVYPSLYEGFGMPPLEAMTCGTVSIVANRSCLPEVAGEGALFFDPDLPDDLEDKMLTVMRNESLREDFIEKGSEWVSRYSWDKTAAQVFDVYRSIAGCR